MGAIQSALHVMGRMSDSVTRALRLTPANYEEHVEPPFFTLMVQTGAALVYCMAAYGVTIFKASTIGSASDDSSDEAEDDGCWSTENLVFPVLRSDFQPPPD